MEPPPPPPPQPPPFEPHKPATIPRRTILLVALGAVAAIVIFSLYGSEDSRDVSSKCDRIWSHLEGSREIDRTLVLRAQEPDSPGGSQITPEEEAEFTYYDKQTERLYAQWQEECE